MNRPTIEETCAEALASICDTIAKLSAQVLRLGQCVECGECDGQDGQTRGGEFRCNGCIRPDDDEMTPAQELKALRDWFAEQDRLGNIRPLVDIMHDRHGCGCACAQCDVGPCERCGP